MGNGKEWRELPVEERFQFGENWAHFLEGLTDERIRDAEASLHNALGIDLSGKRFLDIGSGSGLFSLAARNLGALVTSIDFDPNSVGCTRYLKDRFRADDENWKIEQGSVLDKDFLESFGTFDVVYSWGVLHHTGRMWDAIGNAASRVNEKGYLYIAIYNDQGGYSQRWETVKRLYVKTPRVLQPLYCGAVLVALEFKPIIGQLVRLKNPINYWKAKTSERGMAFWPDFVDWVGGYPFEVARPEEVFDYCKERGFHLQHLKTCRGEKGCNEFVFSKGSQVDSCAE